MNKLLTSIKPGDKIFSHSADSGPGATYEIFQVETYDLADDGDWADYTGRILYSNKRTSKEKLESKKSFFNCKGIKEVIPDNVVDAYVKSYSLFDPHTCPFSEGEMENFKSLYENKLFEPH